MSRRILILDNSMRSFENFRRSTFEEITQRLGIGYKIHAPIKMNYFWLTVVRFMEDLFCKRNQVVVLITIPSIVLTPICFLFAKKLILFFPGLGRTFRGSSHKLFHKFLRVYLTFCVKLSSNVVVLNKADKIALGNYPKIIILHSEGLELNKRCKVNQKKSFKNLSFVGRPIRDKGFEAFLDEVEFRNNPNFTYNFFGDGFEDVELRRRSAKLENTTQNYIVHGYCEKSKIWSNTDVLFFPSVYGEGFPFVVLEALRNGCHVFLKHSHWTEHLPRVDAIVFEDDRRFDEYIAEVNVESASDQSSILISKYLLDFHDISTVTVPFWIGILSD